MPFPKSKYEVVACRPRSSCEPNPMHPANARLHVAARSGSTCCVSRPHSVSAGAGAPASRQSTKAADIPRPRASSPARLSYGVGPPAVKVCRSAASRSAVSVCAARGYRSVPSPSALAVKNVSQSVEAAGHPAAAPGTSSSARPFARPRSLLSRLSFSAVPQPVLPNRFIERTNAGVPSFAAHVER